MKLLYFVLFLILNYPIQGIAGDAYNSCINKANGIMVAIFDCQHAELDGLDKQLNKTYQKLLKTLKENGDDSKLIVQSQKDWIHYRDSRCLSKTIYGGQNANLFYLDCMINMTKEKIIDINDFIEFTQSH